MGAIIVLTPMVVSAWPAVAAAIAGAAASMGFSMADAARQGEATTRKKTVESEIENSDVVADGMSRGERIVIEKDGLTIEFGRDARGACTVCVTGEKQSEAELRKVGQEVAGRVVQQYAYHKLMTELKKRRYSVVDESVTADQSIQIRVRL